ncbi:ribose-5-phosphate isomerase [soil metagenome]|jgi:ribose 5-phosphate isomerase B
MTRMRVYLGSDHAGFELKSILIAHLSAAGHEAVDCGPAEYVAGDDYPPHCVATAVRVVDDPGSLGVVIGGSGNGEQIAANKVRGARAALVYNLETAQLAREHNDANVAGIGARMHSEDEATAIIDTFVNTPFSQDPRHIRRIDMLTAYEQSGILPG